ncbi:hypothetical protein JHL18_00720 [Clostridium sp. YIM B02505]|uniref:Uncharacterized protein n=1 Tax=Clostridium yunnanense TaxID=2800325 RepID=A0ABS1EII7_9CLOT|nr:hypothetical protein [Clostridium yunnanense]MBK1809171.1 hypothetical protein [Clostridium yunnanense]
MVSNIENLEEKLRTGYFYYNKFGLFIKSKVKEITTEDNKINIEFEGGQVETTLSKIEIIEDKTNVATRFEWCYKVKNSFNEEMGFIGHER